MADSGGDTNMGGRQRLCQESQRWTSETLAVNMFKTVNFQRIQTIRWRSEDILRCAGVLPYISSRWTHHFEFEIWGKWTRYESVCIYLIIGWKRLQWHGATFFIWWISIQHGVGMNAAMNRSKTFHQTQKTISLCAQTGVFSKETSDILQWKRTGFVVFNSLCRNVEVVGIFVQ